ncbi:MAG: hypothetical protein K6E99_04930 [Bacilli bacterium]|nr:hypothetical protein [Bacilli bacterium]
MKKIMIGIIIVLFGSISVTVCFFLSRPISIENISYSNLNDDLSKTLTISLKNTDTFSSCTINGLDWIKPVDNKCSFPVKDGEFIIKVKNFLTNSEKPIEVSINDISNIELNTHDYYLAPDEAYNLRANVSIVGSLKDYTLTWESEDPSIVEIVDGKITGKNVGSTKVKVSYINGVSDETTVTVTDLIRKQELDDKKKTVPCHAYTEEEASLLDKILDSRVQAEGEGTRAALLQVIRFITLNFKYKVPYFFEHGRLNNTSGQRYVDGEGRYYHKGLYLSENKYADLKKSHCKPQMWGCGLPNYDDLYGWTIGGLYPNGLDCSGFVSWAFLNSGKDVGDFGSGFNEQGFDLSDLGPHHTITYEFMNSNKYKVGDIIGWNGHIALIAGKDDKYIYIAESLNKGLRINKKNYVDRNSDLYKENTYSYVATLSDFYSEDGAYTDYWE